MASSSRPNDSSSFINPTNYYIQTPAEYNFFFTYPMAVFRYRNMVSRSQTGTANSDLTAAAVAVSLLLPLTAVHTYKFSCRKQNFLLHIHTLW
jgi:hypothetical protein